MKHWNKAVASGSPAYWYRVIGKQWTVVPDMGDEPIAQVLIEWKFVNGKYRKSILLDLDDKFRIFFAPTQEFKVKHGKIHKLPKPTAQEKKLAHKKRKKA